MDLLVRTRFKTNALESAESDSWRTLDIRELEIDLNDLIQKTDTLINAGMSDSGADLYEQLPSNP